MRLLTHCAAAIGAAGFLSSPVLAAEKCAEEFFCGAWVASLTPDEATRAAGQSAFRDEVLFHEGQFSAAALAMLGFAPQTFAASYANGSPSFVAMLASDDRGSLVWQGSADNSNIDGTLIWVRLDGSTSRYSFVAHRPATD